MQSIQKYCSEFFLQSAYFLDLFSSYHAQHVMSPWYVCYEHTKGIKGYVTNYLTCYVRLQVQNMPYYMRLRVQNMPGCDLRKYWWIKWANWRKKSQEYFCTDCIHFLCLFNVFHIFTAPTCTTTIITLEPCALNAEFQHFIPDLIKNSYFSDTTEREG
jgi:hypothetical protein